MTSLTVDARLLIDSPSTLEGRIKDKNIPCTQVFTAFSVRLTCLQPDAAFNLFGAKVHQKLRYNIIIIKNVIIFIGQPSGAVVSTVASQALSLNLPSVWSLHVLSVLHF